MRAKNRYLSVFLCVTLLFLSLFTQKTSALAQTGRITGDGVNMRATPDSKNSEIVATLGVGTVVQINKTVTGNEAVQGAGTTW